MKKKKCPVCKGDGYVMIDENPEECENCEGTGEVEEDEEEDLFEQMANLVRPYNKLILEIYSPFQF